MLNKFRERLDAYFTSVGKKFSALGLSPTGWTVVGFLVCLAAAAAYSYSGYWSQLTGGVLFLISGSFDIIDGAVARVIGNVSKKGAFIDSTLDRAGESAIFLGILLGGYLPPYLVLVALSLSLLVSYTRARAESLGGNLSGVGVGERGERVLAIVVTSLVGAVWLGVYVVIVLAGYTFIERTVRAWRTL